MVYLKQALVFDIGALDYCWNLIDLKKSTRNHSQCTEKEILETDANCLYLRKVQLGVYMVLNTLAKASVDVYPEDHFPWELDLCDAFKTSVRACSWFLSELASSENWLRNVLLKARVSSFAKSLVHVIIQAMKTLEQSESHLYHNPPLLDPQSTRSTRGDDIEQLSDAESSDSVDSSDESIPMKVSQTIRVIDRLLSFLPNAVVEDYRYCSNYW